MAVTLFSRNDLALVQIGCERPGITLATHHGQVAVGPHKIDGVALQAAPPHIALPSERVQRQMSLLTYCPNLMAGLSIDVYLPIQRSEWLEIVLGRATSTGLHPRQAIASAQATYPTLAQGTSPVVHRRLGR